MLTGVHVATIAEIKYKICFYYIYFFFFTVKFPVCRYLIPEAVNTVRAL